MSLPCGPGASRRSIDAGRSAFVSIAFHSAKQSATTI